MTEGPIEPRRNPPLPKVVKPARFIPAPKTSSWKVVHGTWENFLKAVHRSTGVVPVRGVLGASGIPKSKRPNAADEKVKSDPDKKGS